VTAVVYQTLKQKAGEGHQLLGGASVPRLPTERCRAVSCNAQGSEQVDDWRISRQLTAAVQCSSPRVSSSRRPSMVVSAVILPHF